MLTFETDPRALKKALAILKPCVAGKSTKRLFECVLVSAAGGTVELSATDLEWAATVDLDATIRGCGMAVVPFYQLVDIAKAKTERVRFTGQGLDLLAEWSGAKTEAERLIVGEDPEQYPEIPRVTGRWTHVPDLGTAIREALPFAGQEAARFVLNGIQLAEGCVVATDGRRLYRGNVAGLPDCGLIPGPRWRGKALDSWTHVRASERAIEFSGKGFRIVARVMDGSFPSWRDIVPNGSAHEWPCDAEAWTEAIGNVAGCTSVESQSIIVDLDGESVTFEAAGGDSRGKCRINSTPGPAMDRIGFNPNYMLDFLKLRPTAFHATNKNSAAKWTTERADLVLMPVLID